MGVNSKGAEEGCLLVFCFVFVCFFVVVFGFFSFFFFTVAPQQ